MRSSMVRGVGVGYRDDWCYGTPTTTMWLVDDSDTKTATSLTVLMNEGGRLSYRVINKKHRDIKTILGF